MACLTILLWSMGCRLLIFIGVVNFYYNHHSVVNLRRAGARCHTRRDSVCVRVWGGGLGILSNSAPCECRKKIQKCSKVHHFIKKFNQLIKNHSKTISVIFSLRSKLRASEVNKENQYQMSTMFTGNFNYFGNLSKQSK